MDTNIIISGLFWSGKENKLLELAVAEEYKAIICEFVLQETKRVIENISADQALQKLDC